MFKYDIQAVDGETIIIKVSPEIASDLVFILDELISFSRVVRSKSRAADGLRKAVDPQDRLRREQAFNDESIKVFARYLDHRTLGLTDREAIQKIKKDFKLGYGEAKICLVQGRKLARKPKLKPAAIREEQIMTLSPVSFRSN